MDLREEPSGDLHMLPYLMQRLIVIANATGVEPVGAWWRATSRGLVAGYDDTIEAAVTGRRAGFRGALCMRPEQAAAFNLGFTPSCSEAERLDSSDPSELTATLMVDLSSDVIEWLHACEDRDKAKELVRSQARILAQ